MTIDEFQSVISIGDVCSVSSQTINNNSCLILNAEYQGMWSCEEGKDLLHFKVLNGPWHFQIPLQLIRQVDRYSVFFTD